jgi:hypothetical protein
MVSRAHRGVGARDESLDSRLILKRGHKAMADEGTAKEGTAVCHSMGATVGAVLGTTRTAHGELLLLVRRGEEFGGGVVVVPASQVDVSDTVALPLDAEGVAMLPSYVEEVPISRYLDYWRRFTYSAAATDPPTATVSDQYRALAAGRERARQAHAAHPQGPRPDVDIAADVREELRNDRQLDVHKIKVEVFGAVVVLEGEQNDLVARRAAEQAAFSVADVRDVVNMLVVNASI